MLTVCYVPVICTEVLSIMNIIYLLVYKFLPKFYTGPTEIEDPIFSNAHHNG